MHAKSPVCGIITEDVNSECDASLSKPDEPPPVLLIPPYVPVSPSNGAQEALCHPISAPAARVDVERGVWDVEQLREGYLIADLPSRFWRNASNFRGFSEFLLHLVATIIIAYSEIYLVFIL